MKKEEKTNVMRVLDGKKICYESHSYEPDAAMSGKEIAGILGEEPEKVFKTLVTQGKSGAYYVFVIPVDAELDLKKAAKVSGEKAVGIICHTSRYTSPPLAYSDIQPFRIYPAASALMTMPKNSIDFSKHFLYHSHIFQSRAPAPLHRLQRYYSTTIFIFCY